MSQKKLSLIIIKVCKYMQLKSVKLHIGISINNNTDTFEDYLSYPYLPWPTNNKLSLNPQIAL